MNHGTPAIVPRPSVPSSKATQSADVIPRHPHELPEHRQKAAAMFALYHGAYTVAWFTGGMVLAACNVEYINWIGACVLSGVGVCFLCTGICEFAARTQKKTAIIAFLIFSIINVAIITAIILWLEFTFLTLPIFVGYLYPNWFTSFGLAVWCVLSLGEVITSLWFIVRCMSALLRNTKDQSRDVAMHPRTSNGIGSIQWGNAIAVTLHAACGFLMYEAKFVPMGCMQLVFFMASISTGLCAFVASDTKKKSVVKAFFVMSVIVLTCAVVLLLWNLFGAQNNNYTGRHDIKYRYYYLQFITLGVGYFSMAIYVEQICISFWSVLICWKTVHGPMNMAAAIEDRESQMEPPSAPRSDYQRPRLDHGRPQLEYTASHVRHQQRRSKYESVAEQNDDQYEDLTDHHHGYVRMQPGVYATIAAENDRASQSSSQRRGRGKY